MIKYNFNPGPSILPKAVFQEASKAVIDFNQSGLSILEISHRSKDFVAIMDEAESLVRELLQLPDHYKPLFLQGGASTQFLMSAINFLPQEGNAGYVDTGSWSSKAIKEAKNFGNVDVLATSKPENYNHIPKNYSIPSDLDYLHITSNNTIFGTQFHSWPETSVPLICDMSSDIFSRPLPIEKFDLIYAGAQKNMGPAGVTLAIVNTESLGRVERTIPTILNYQTHIAKDSSFNTPPVFPIYVSMLTLRWLKNNGGITWIQERNQKKADALYAEIDRNSLFVGTAAKEDRSKMNVTFVMHDDNLMGDFLTYAESKGCVGIKGHRSVGGFRASIYNAMPPEGVQTLIEAMQNFENQHGQG